MSDAYKIGDVTVSPQGGGWYEVSHTTLPEPEKIQGKDSADARAMELGKAQPSDDTGSMDPQGADLSGVSLVLPEGALSAEEVADLRAKLAEQLAACNLAEQRAQQVEETVETLKVKTVQTDGGAVPDPARVPAGVPRRYEGILDDKAKAEMKRLGLNIVRIVLEENENIPPTGLYVGHNGRGYMIVPGEEVDVPDFLLNVLNDAVMSAPVVDSKTQKVLGYRNRSRYPYRRV